MAGLPLEVMERKASEVADFLMAAANKNRLMVLCHLAEAGELTVNDLAARLNLSQPALSQHLAVLRNQGLVKTRRQAQTIFYSVAEGPAMDIVTLLHQHFCGNQ